MIIEGLILIVANSVFWIVVSFAWGYLCHFIPFSFYNIKNPIFKKRFWELEGKLYEKVFFVKYWKDIMPEAGELIKIHPFNKKKLKSKEKSYIERFIIETCRAELVHILIFLSTPFAFLFNPPIGDYITVACGVLASIPFIIIQRYNRIRLVRVLEKIEKKKCIKEFKEQNELLCNRKTQFSRWCF
jgi:glycosyl-4,4'-diaponeurosporenoate acyltransferase